MPRQIEATIQSFAFSLFILLILHLLRNVFAKLRAQDQRYHGVVAIACRSITDWKSGGHPAREPPRSLGKSLLGRAPRRHFGREVSGEQLGVCCLSKRGRQKTFVRVHLRTKQAEVGGRPGRRPLRRLRRDSTPKALMNLSKMRGYSGLGIGNNCSGLLA